MAESFELNPLDTVSTVYRGTDIQTNPPVITDGEGITEPSQFVLFSINLILNDSSTFELKPALIELSIYEDLFSPTSSGYVIITDSMGFIEELNLTGFNFIEIKFAKTGSNDPNEYARIFRVYKIGERKQTSIGNEQYAIHFCSEEVLLSEQIRVAKSYAEKPIDLIIYSILSDYMKVPDRKINIIEETNGNYNFVIPNLKPFEAINWLATYAQPLDTRKIGADMLFFENRNGFNFRSIQSMIKEKEYNIYNYSPANQRRSTRDVDYTTSSILSYRFKQTFDTLKAISSGAFANKLVSLDPLLRKTKITKFDYENYFNQAETLNEEKLTTGSTNRLNKKVNEMYDSVFKILTTNDEQRRFESIKAESDTLGAVAPSIGLEVYIPNRTAQLSLINYNKIEFLIPGDPGLTVGNVVELMIPSFGPPGNKIDSQLDKYQSGRYLVSAVRHKMDMSGTYHCLVEAIKDSVSSKNTDAQISQASYEVNIA